MDVDVGGGSWVGGVWCKASGQQWRRYGSVTDNKARDVAQQSGAASLRVSMPLPETESDKPLTSKQARSIRS